MFFLRPRRMLFMATSREGYESIYDTTFWGVCQIYFYFFVVVEGREGIRLCGMARDRPSPYGEGAFFFVARGPVPRERWSACGMARDRPSPYGEGGLFFS